MTGATGLISSLELALKSAHLSRARSDIREAIEAGGSGIRQVLSTLTKGKASQFEVGAVVQGEPPAIVIPIDQAEELFSPDGVKEAESFLPLLRNLLVRDMPSVITVFTIRSDQYEQLQSATAFDGLHQRTLSLGPVPQGNYANIIEGPLTRLSGTDRKLVIEQPLVQSLLADIEDGRAKDALPLLAFTLERLYLEFRGAGRLTVDHYTKLGRIKGSLEAAVERALHSADTILSIPRDRQRRLELIRRGLVPWLASIDAETGAPRRRVAFRSEIPEASRPLIDLLVDQRLLCTDIAKDTGEPTIEVAHEALLRQWGLLEGWLREDASQLNVADGIKRAAKAWIEHGSQSAWLTHTGGNLTAAERLRKRSDLAQFLSETEKAYLVACRSKVRRQKGWVATLAVAIIAVAALAYQGILDATYLAGQYNGIRNRIRDASLTPGAVTRDCGSQVCPEMVMIPSGEFLMGSPETDRDRVDDEGPRHKVTMTKPLLVSKYEVTFDEWDACYKAGGCSLRPRDQGWGRGKHPVIYVSWNDIQQYLKWLSTKTGMPYRLLTEAEWEYAARGAASTSKPYRVYPWGNEVGRGHANCDGCLGGETMKKTMPVGSFNPNSFGLYDVVGNVWEWVQDCYDAKRYAGHEQTDVAAPPGTSNCSRVVRGGSWSNSPRIARVAYRNRYMPGLRFSNVGFRVARFLSSTTSFWSMPR